jgi:hypothetical protein
MTTFDLYFVAFHKHGEAQVLYDGPFLDWDDAKHARDKRGASYCIVVATLTPTRMEEL